MNNIILRKLKKKDAEFMLEWMHDQKVVKYMQTDFLNKNINDCIMFIEKANNSDIDLHLAIVDSTDEYLGTVSLKYIDENNAEFAIAIRKKYMGKGYAKEAMKKVIKIAYDQYNLKSIYWCVNPINVRAIRFYDKNGYKKIYWKKLEINVHYDYEQIEKYIWYKYDLKH